MKRIEVEQNTILVGLVGSHAYGTSRPDSDTDYRGVFIAPKRFYLGIETVEQKDGGWNEAGVIPFLDNNADTTIYELRKFIKLLAGANPNILELLWLRTYPFLTDIGRDLINQRSGFLSKKVKKTYSGYAYAQIRKIETHRKWLLNPPEKKPTHKDFQLEEPEIFTKSELNAFLGYVYALIRERVEFLSEAEQLYALLTEDIDIKGVLLHHPLPTEAIAYTQKLTRSNSDYIGLLQRNQAYIKALTEWDSYQSWKKNRNVARAGMETKAGYDLKHAMHCVRLIRSGTEILRDGIVLVDRREAGDAKELKAILNGDYSYESLTELVKASMAGLEDIYKKSTLPDRPDIGQVNDICVKLVETWGLR